MESGALLCSPFAVRSRCSEGLRGARRFLEAAPSPTWILRLRAAAPWRREPSAGSLVAAAATIAAAAEPTARTVRVAGTRAASPSARSASAGTGRRSAGATSAAALLKGHEDPLVVGVAAVVETERTSGALADDA